MRQTNTLRRTRQYVCTGSTGTVSSPIPSVSYRLECLRIADICVLQMPRFSLASRSSRTIDSLSIARRTNDDAKSLHTISSSSRILLHRYGPNSAPSDPTDSERLVRVPNRCHGIGAPRRGGSLAKERRRSPRGRSAVGRLLVDLLGTSDPELRAGKSMDRVEIIRPRFPHGPDPVSNQSRSRFLGIQQWVRGA